MDANNAAHETATGHETANTPPLTSPDIEKLKVKKGKKPAWKGWSDRLVYCTWWVYKTRFRVGT